MSCFCVLRMWYVSLLCFFDGVTGMKSGLYESML